MKAEREEIFDWKEDHKMREMQLFLKRELTAEGGGGEGMNCYLKSGCAGVKVLLASGRKTGLPFH